MFASLAIAPPTFAQCASQWLPGEGLQGANGEVRAMAMWDPDGAGPAPSVLVVGGNFTMVGTATGSIAIHDPATDAWSTLGSGLNGPVSALTTLPNGDLVAGGTFTFAGGVAANFIARWNGTAWSALDSGTTGSVHALATLANGDLVAGGSFSSAGGAASTSGIARWDGTAWSSLGSGVAAGGSSPEVRALAVSPTGDLYAGGFFTTAGGQAANRVAKWNGTTWSALGSGIVGAYTGAPVTALAWLPNGSLIASGHFFTAGGIPANGIAQWNGGAWSALGSGFGGVTLPHAATLHAQPNGDLVAGGNFATAGGTAANRLARWNGTAWSAFGSGCGTGQYEAVQALTMLPSGDLIAGGSFTVAGGLPADNLARWNGAWSAFGTGRNGHIHSILTLLNGDVVIGGGFTTCGGAVVNHIARRSGSTWSPLGSGVDGNVHALVALANGDIIAAGGFTSAGGVGANRIARWNGTAWSTLGSGMNSTVYALAVLPSGELVAGGDFTSAGGVIANGIARWNGTTWLTMGSMTTNAPPLSVGALAVLSNGQLVAGGNFTMAGNTAANCVARWTGGTTWSPLGQGTAGPVVALAAESNGGLVAGVSGGDVVRWDGASWTTIGFASSQSWPYGALALTSLPTGHIAAGGHFDFVSGAGTSGGQNIALWDGTSWSSLGTGLDGIVHALAVLPNGDLLAGGEFLTADGRTSAYLAHRTTSCNAADVTAYGRRCTSSWSSFYELFDQGVFDLAGTTTQSSVVSLAKVGNQYHVAASNGAWFSPASPALTLGDDDWTTVTLPFALPLPAGPLANVNQLYVGSNGILEPVGPNSTGMFEISGYADASALQSSTPWFAPFRTDLDPSAGGAVHYDIDPSSNAAYVTWLAVPSWGTPGSACTFQMAFFVDGTVEYRYRSMNPNLTSPFRAMTGWSSGNTATDPGNLDLTAELPFPTGPLDDTLTFDTAGTRAVINQAVTFRVGGIPPGGAAVLGFVVVGFTKYDPGTSLLSVGMPGCYQHASVDFSLPFAPAAPTANIGLLLPNMPNLVGVHLHAQTALFGNLYTPLGAMVSQGIDLRVGTY